MTAIQILLHKEWKKIEADLSSEFSVMVYSKDVDYKSYNYNNNELGWIDFILGLDSENRQILTEYVFNNK